jgi:NTE family protein
MTFRKKALVLSGGGGRGAYQAGAIAGLFACGWLDARGPDYIAGTSIGAVHAAALASGKQPADFAEFWTQGITTERVQRGEGIVRRAALSLLTLGLLSPRPDDGDLTDEQRERIERYEVEESFETPWWVSIASHLRDRLLPDAHVFTSTWDEALSPLALDFERINSPAAPELLIVATDLQRGSPQVFRNNRNGAAHAGLRPEHIRASASIQILYQPTEIDGRYYWDGAVVANTPLDQLLDAAGDDDLDIVTVLMSPWCEDGCGEIAPPCNLYSTLAPALDWMMLASFRVALKRLTDRYRPGPRIIAPGPELWREHMNVDRLLIYDPEVSSFLFEQGYSDAVAAMR